MKKIELKNLFSKYHLILCKQLVKS